MWRLLYTEVDDFPFPPEFEARAEELGVELRTTPGCGRDEMRRVGRDCHGVFVRNASIDGGLLDAWGHCRVVARVGTGYDKIDVAAARLREVEVTYVPNFCSDELSDSAMLFILALARQLPAVTSPGAKGRWRSPGEIPMLTSLRGMSLGILGFGASGQKLAAKALPFGLQLRTWTRTPNPELFAALGIEPASFEEALASDIVSIHLPLNGHTRGLIGASELGQFAPGGWLINIARGAIVDTNALVASLRSGHLGGAGLDVTDPEPLPDNHPLWGFDNVIITPHCAGEGKSTDVYLLALEDAVAVLEGGTPRHPVPQ